MYRSMFYVTYFLITEGFVVKVYILPRLTQSDTYPMYSQLFIILSCIISKRSTKFARSEKDITAGPMKIF